MNGVTGRMGTNQHLMRSIVAIRDAGRRRARRRRRASCPTRSWSAATPTKLEALAEAHGIARWTHRPRRGARRPRRHDLSSTPARRRLRADAASRKAIAAGKHVYCEKPIATDARRGARDLPRAREARGREARRGAGQAVPAGPAQARACCVDAGFFGRILSRARRVRLLGVRGRPGSRPSGRRGTTARRTAAASSSTCCATGATCSTTCSAR